MGRIAKFQSNHSEKSFILETKMNYVENKVDDWKIRKTLRNKQWDKKGIKKGFRLVRVDDMEVNEENRDAIIKILREGKACELEFDTASDKEEATPQSAGAGAENDSDPAE